jgi:two-component system sensor histidine kinase ChiS
VLNEVAADTPPVQADPDRLQQILGNLLTNAIKYTHHGLVRISAEVCDGEVLVRVSDTGVGVALQDQQRIFESFEQADTTTSRRYEGLGLGLAISRRLVQMHGGQIGVQSTLGEGSTFWFTLPMVTSSAFAHHARHDGGLPG